VQEARDKQPETTARARWHLIGHLQSNKAKDAVRLFDVIQTIDSIDLAEKIAKAAGEKRPEVLLQVNVGRESQKSGIEVEDVATVAKRVGELLDLRGLMTIPPHGAPDQPLDSSDRHQLDRFEK